MGGEAFALALGAAVLHAGWNVLLAGSRELMEREVLPALRGR